MKFYKKYITVIKISTQRTLQYRVDTFLQWLISALSLVVPFSFWRTVYCERQEILGYEIDEMMTYVVLTALLGRLLIYDGIHNEISMNIRDGKLSQFLWRPVNYKMYIFFSTTGKKVIGFILLLLLYSIFLIPMNMLDYLRINLSLRNIMLFIISGGLGMMISFFIYYILGMIAFWMLDCSALYIMVGTLFYFFAGGLFPLDMFRGIKILSAIMPYQYQLFFPVKVLIGSMTCVLVLKGIGIQLIWCSILWGLSVIIWKHGIRRYSSVGN